MKKYLPWIFLGVIIALAGPFIYKQWSEATSLRKSLLAASQELSEARLEIGRGETKLADADGTIKLLRKEVRDEIKKRQALITAYGELEGTLAAEKKKVKTLTRIVYKDKPGTIDLPKGKIFIREDDGSYTELQQMTLEYKDFRIDIEANCLESQLSYKLHQKFKGQLVETKLPTGAYNHYFNLWEVDDQDQKVAELKLDKFTVLKRDPNKASFKWFNPKLDLFFGGGIALNGEGTWLGDIGISLASYGKTSNNYTLRFLRIGAGLTRHGFSVSFSPIQLNIGQFLPLISNLHLVPYIGYDSSVNTFHAGLGVSVVL